MRGGSSQTLSDAVSSLRDPSAGSRYSKPSGGGHPEAEGGSYVLAAPEAQAYRGAPGASIPESVHID